MKVLGALGLVSNHNLSTRWTHHSFDSASCFATCYNLGDVLENCVTLERSMFHLPAPKQEIALCSSQGFSLPSCSYHFSRVYFSVICVDHVGEPRKPYFQVPVTDAEDYLRLLLLPDNNDISDVESPVSYFLSETSSPRGNEIRPG